MWEYKKGGENVSTILIGIIISVVVGFGGGVYVGNKTAPKEIVYNVSQYQVQKQEQYLIDIEVEDNEFESNITIQISGQTNVRVFTLQDGKIEIIAETNTFLPSWLPEFPKIE